MTDQEYREHVLSRTCGKSHHQHSGKEKCPLYMERSRRLQRARYARTYADPEARERKRTRNRLRYASDPEYRQKRIDAGRRSYNPASRKARYESDPEYRRRLLDASARYQAAHPERRMLRELAHVIARDEAALAALMKETG